MSNKTMSNLKDYRHNNMRLSELLRSTIEDVKSLRRSKGYQVDMGTWVNPIEYNDGEKICSFCVAGARMIKQLGVTEYVNSPGDISKSLERWFLTSIDCFRVGNFLEALNNLGIDKGEEELRKAWSEDMEDFYGNPGKFYRAWDKFITKIEQLEKV